MKLTILELTFVMHKLMLNMLELLKEFQMQFIVYPILTCKLASPTELVVFPLTLVDYFAFLVCQSSVPFPKGVQKVSLILEVVFINFLPSTVDYYLSYLT